MSKQLEEIALEIDTSGTDEIAKKELDIKMRVAYERYSSIEEIDGNKVNVIGLGLSYKKEKGLDITLFYKIGEEEYEKKYTETEFFSQFPGQN